MKTHKNILLIATQICSILLVTIIAAAVHAQTPTALSTNNRIAATPAAQFVPRLRWSLTPVGFRLVPATSPRRNAGLASNSNLMPMVAGPSLQVLGSGTVGRLTKWTGLTSSNSLIGDSTIFEDKFGKVGIGTDTPTSRFTVAGMIETTLGGLKFPDGTVQTTSAAGALFSVAHDTTLQGNGTIGSPLGVAIPLILTNASPGGLGLQALGGDGAGNRGGDAVSAIGGDTTAGQGGDGVTATGGNSITGTGGRGVFSIGGTSSSNMGGFGVVGVGGTSDTGDAGIGIAGVGAASASAFGGIGVRGIGGNGGSTGNGGNGLDSVGGTASGAGNRGGMGINAIGGLGVNGADKGLAGFFDGHVSVTGTLAKGGGSFKIDHPLDPENKYLYHSFVESPDMKNIYDGNVTTDANGDAVVEMPDYFDALNKDFRYQLTVLGTFAQAIVAEKIKANRFRIKTDAPNIEVSWQVTGTRRDAYANKNRIKVEEEKTNKERGFYLHPDAFNQPQERGVAWAANPELMQRMKEAQRMEIEASKQKPTKQ